MKVLIIFLTFILWMEKLQASVIKQEEPFMELKINQRDQKGEKRQNFKDVVQDEAEPLNEIEFYNAKFINTSSPNYKKNENLLLRAGLFEGDIDGFSASDTSKPSQALSAVRDLNCRWPDAVVPYTISSVFDHAARILIARALLEYHMRTCVRFVPRTENHKDYIYFMEGQGCYAKVGRSGGAQNVSLGKECHQFGLILHELMHAIGFWHEQSRADRDDFVTIVWDNIDKEQVQNFKKYSWSYITNLSEAYDYDSIMHYPPHAFALRKGEPTVIPKEKGKVIGQSRGFSEVDLRKINKLYNCQINEAGRIVGDCADGEGWCAEYEKRGECKKNPAWMRTSCMKSCGMCGADCIDRTNLCSQWSEKGLCKTNSGYMKIFCKKSCKLCA